MDQLLADYQTLHQIPEEGFCEFQTQEYILNRLSKLSCKIHKVNPMGIIAFFNCNCQKTIAFRAEMDALPIKEKTGLAFASKNPDFMHACGHDGNMSVLLAVCDYLSNTFTNVNVACIFQPSEESYGGSLAILADSFFQALNIAEIYAIHFWPKLAYGKAFSKDGELLAASTEVDIKFIGKNVHIADYQEGIDAIQTAAIFLSSLEKAANIIVNFGVIEGKGKRNIICNKVNLYGSVRSLNNQDMTNYLEYINMLAFQACRTTPAKTIVEIRKTPTVKNSYELFQRNNLYECEAFFQSDDFGYYTESIPALYILIGTGDSPALHSDMFYIDFTLLEVAYKTIIDIIKKA